MSPIIATTFCPRARPLPAGAASTVPAASMPGTRGKLTPTLTPSRSFSSERLRPNASTRMRTQPSRSGGSGSVVSRRLSTGPGADSRTARMVAGEEVTGVINRRPLPLHSRGATWARASSPVYNAGMNDPSPSSPAPPRVTVVVIAPALGPDFRWIRDIDPRLDVVDGNASAEGGERALGSADVVLVGYPVPKAIAGHAPRLRWAQHTQAGVSDLHDTDLWESEVVLTSTRGAVGATGIAEYVLAGVYHFGRGLHEATRQKAAGQFNRSAYRLQPLTGAPTR